MYLLNYTAGGYCVRQTFLGSFLVILLLFYSPKNDLSRLFLQKVNFFLGEDGDAIFLKKLGADAVTVDKFS